MNFSRFTSHYSVFNQPPRQKRNGLQPSPLDLGVRRCCERRVLNIASFSAFASPETNFFSFFFGAAPPKPPKTGAPHGVFAEISPPGLAFEVKRRKTSSNIASLREKSSRLTGNFGGFLRIFHKGGTAKRRPDDFAKDSGAGLTGSPERL